MRFTHRITIQELSSGQRAVHECGGYMLSMLTGETNGLGIVGAFGDDDAAILLATMYETIDQQDPTFRPRLERAIAEHKAENGDPDVELVKVGLPSPPAPVAPLEAMMHMGPPAKLQRIVVTEEDDPAHPVVFENLEALVICAHQKGMPDNATMCMLQSGLTVKDLAKLFGSFCIAMQGMRPGLPRQIIEAYEKHGSFKAEFLEIPGGANG